MNRSSSEPIPAGYQVEEALAMMGVPRVAASLRIRREWRDLVSGDWRDKARPMVLEEGCLVVEVRSQMDAALLRYGTAALAEQVNAGLGSRVVTSVKITIPRT
ncbi:MAG: DciA family protein [bacterium]|nr:DciA family protein [bacterium]MDE0600708.1 DciA family protein [bacterium]